jgi:hypothetical protein
MTNTKFAAREHPDTPHALGLLRARRERTCSRHTDKNGDELAPL